ncbi:M10 family metallopeptidase C-terminal domain-containing protein [Pseudoduganella lutea]|nr:M10 family metallopeptidase C-terminal domain-containing protein [Pseudoduganella lutea]
MQSSGNNAIDALAYRSWNAGPGMALTLTYSFLATPPANASAMDIFGFVPMSAAQQGAARVAMATWSAAANITFTEVAGGGQLLMGVNDQGSKSGAYAYYPNPAGSSALYLNDEGYNTVFTPGSFGAHVLIHELGHTLGLKHPGNYNATGGGAPGPFLPVDTDNADYTLMSYYGGRSEAINGKYPVSPMVYDVLAIQYLYGANLQYRTGDDVYAFGNAAAPSCIWDAGGINTFDFSACVGTTLINLNEGAFSETASKLRNVSIAYGVEVRRALAGNGGSTIVANDLGNTITGGAGIDDVFGGAGHDSITGGAGDDTLRGDGGNDSLQGGVGNDRLDGGAGNDTIDGGSGTDTAVLAYRFEDTTRVWLNATDLQVTDNATGITVTLRGIETIVFDGVTMALDETVGSWSPTGTRMADLLTGTGAADILAGLAGNDTLAALGGDDSLDGGTGNDSLAGGEGNDTLVAATGRDTLAGGAGDDLYVIGTATATLLEEAMGGHDAARTTLATWTLAQGVEDLAGTQAGRAYRFTGNALDNAIHGNSGNDVLSGGAGNDTLRGAAGRDSLAGGDGDDHLEGGTGNDTLDGGAGNDTAVFAQALASYTRSRPTAGDLKLVDTVSKEVIVVRNTETLVFAGMSYSLDDLRLGLVSTGDDMLTGTTGADTIDGLAGNDTMTGLAGNDTYVIGAAGDAIVEETGGGIDMARIAIAGTGFTHALAENVENATIVSRVAGSVTGNAADNALTGNAAANTLAGAAGNDSLEGGAGNDWLLGGEGDDTLAGGTGSDTLEGGDGDDVHIVDAAGDKVVEAADGGVDTVRTALARWTMAAEVERLEYTGKSGFTGTGNALDNRIGGGGGADRLLGGDGDDTLAGGAGNDLLTGGTGSDAFVLRFDAGSDTVADFVTGIDHVLVDVSVRGIGNGDAVVNGAVTIMAPGGFGTDAELVIVTGGAGTLTTARGAALIGSADAAYAKGDSALFAIDNGTSTVLYRFVSAQADAIVSAGELTQIAQLTGVADAASVEIGFTR